MRRNNFKECLLAGTICAGSLFIAAPAMAQVDPPAAQAAADEDEAIVVTGSRIARRDLESSSPVAVVSSEEFQLSGVVNVEQVLNTLPQVIPAATSFSNNPGGGVATLNLRGLGSQRTLVLVNGRRWMFFDTSQRVDLNTIPSFLIGGADVVTGGASAVYGSDAVAGVVNFRLRDDLEGLEVGAQYNITEEGDAARFNANFALGTRFADDRGGITIFGDYFKRQPVFAGARSYTRFAYGDINGALVPQGSATVPQGRISVAPAVTILAGNSQPQITLPLGVGNYATDFGAFFGTPRTSTAYRDPQDSYNFAPANYLQIPQERIMAGGYGEYDINDHVTAYAEIAFANNRVPNELAATPVTGSIPVNIALNSQYLSPADIAAWQQIDANETAINAARAARGQAPLFGAAAAPGVVELSINRRVLETGARHTLFDTTSFRTLLGLRGDISNNLSYDAYYSYARSRITNIQDGNVSKAAYNAAVLNGTINIYGPNTLTPAMLDLITIRTQNNTESILQVASGSISGTLFNLGWGAEDVGFAIGAEYRKMNSEFIPDKALSTGDVIGFNAGRPTKGGYDVKEAFAELRIPIVADRPFFHSLELNGAARYSKYSLPNVGGVWTYAAGAQWAPIRDISFRANYQRAVRAPNVGELYLGQAQTFNGAVDPCSNRGTVASRTAELRQLCIDSGVPAPLVFTAGIQPNAQIQAILGGNPDLQEEVSDSYTAGVILRPRFIPRLNVTVDYYHINLDGAVNPAGGGVANILSLCYLQIKDLSNPLCGLIRRNPNTGSIQDPYLVTATNVNLGSYDTVGVDINVDYTQPLGFGLLGSTSRLNASMLATYTDSFEIVAVPGLASSLSQCAGRFGTLTCGDPTPKWKWTSRLSWIDGGLTTSFRWRHLSSTRDDNDGRVYVVETLPAYDVFDLSFAAKVTDNLSFTAGINNLFDKHPVIQGGNVQQSATWPSTFDVLGRDFFVSAKVRL